jgi:hypothetical protein
MTEELIEGRSEELKVSCSTEVLNENANCRNSKVQKLRFVEKPEIPWRALSMETPRFWSVFL